MPEREVFWGAVSQETLYFERGDVADIYTI